MNLKAVQFWKFYQWESASFVKITSTKQQFYPENIPKPIRMKRALHHNTHLTHPSLITPASLWMDEDMWSVLRKLMVMEAPSYLHLKVSRGQNREGWDDRWTGRQEENLLHCKLGNLSSSFYLLWSKNMDVFHP